MNCREYRELIDDALDTSLNGTLGHRVKLHLEHCTVCRDYYEHRQKEHVALFTAMNAAYGDVHLPSGFADNVIEMIALEGARRKPFFARVPRWALIAASLVAMAGFVFAATVVVERVALNAPDSTRGDEPNAVEVTEATEETKATAVSSADAVIDSSVPVVSSVASAPTTNYQLEPNPGETTMTRRKAAAAALTAAMAAAPLAAANGDEYQFIVSGDPVAAATVGSSSASSDEITLETGALRVAGTANDLEARSRASRTSVAIALNATKFRTFIMTFR